MAVTEVGHAPNRVYIDHDGQLHLNGSVIYTDETGANIGSPAGRVVNLTAATLAVTKALHDDRIITVNKADGTTLTLPAATGSGMRTTIIVGTTITSVGIVIQVTGDDTMTGHALVAQDGGDTIVAFEAGATADTITMNGSTTGGIKGDIVELIDVAADLWHVRVRSAATGTEATPFSAAV